MSQLQEEQEPPTKIDLDKNNLTLFNLKDYIIQKLYQYINYLGYSEDVNHS